MQWRTENPAYYLRPGGADIGEFSFSGLAYHDNNSTGFDASDPAVVVGDVVRVWFGAVNWTGAGPNYAQEWSLHFDSMGWGSHAPSAGDPFAAGLVGQEGYGSGWEGTLEVSAVPEPGTLLLLGSGLVGLSAGAWRRRRSRA